MNPTNHEIKLEFLSLSVNQTRPGPNVILSGPKTGRSRVTLIPGVTAVLYTAIGFLPADHMYHTIPRYIMRWTFAISPPNTYRHRGRGHRLHRHLHPPGGVFRFFVFQTRIILGPVSPATCRGLNHAVMRTRKDEHGRSE